MEKNNYRVSVFPITCEDGSVEWGAEFPDIRCVGGGGNTPEEAIKEAYENLQAYLEVTPNAIPVPSNPYGNEYSGKLMVRMGKTLHREVALKADEEGVSINALINQAVARLLGGTQGSAE